MHRLRKLLRDVGLALTGVAVLLAVMIFLMRDGINWRAVRHGVGNPVPISAPDERNRIRIGSCSIVLPDRWYGKTYADAANGVADMNAWPDAVMPERYGAGIRVFVSREQPNGLGDASPKRFLDYDAFESIVRREDGGFESPPLYSYTLFFNFDSIWYSLTYWNNDDLSGLPKSVLGYFETFTVDSGNRA